MNTRNLTLCYRASDPRTVRSARKRGWHVIECDRQSFEIDGQLISWLGVNIWADRNIGRYVSSFSLGSFAFESAGDAVLFKLKWCRQ